MPIFRVAVSGDDVEADQTPDTPTPQLFFYDIEAESWDDALVQAPDLWRAETGETGDPRYVQPVTG